MHRVLEISGTVAVSAIMTEMQAGVF